MRTVSIPLTQTQTTSHPADSSLPTYGLCFSPTLEFSVNLPCYQLNFMLFSLPFSTLQDPPTSDFSKLIISHPSLTMHLTFQPHLTPCESLNSPCMLIPISPPLYSPPLIFHHLSALMDCYRGFKIHIKYLIVCIVPQA